MKAIKYLVLVLLLMGGAYVGWSWHLSAHRQKWLWSDRYADVQEATGEEGYFGGFRIHVRPETDSLWQTCGADAISIDSCFAFLEKHEWCSMWLVADSLNEHNLASFTRMVLEGALSHNIAAQRIVVETPRWELLGKFTLLSINTLYAWDAPHPSGLTERQRDSVVTRIYRTARSGQVNTLTVSRAWYPYFHGQLTELNVQFLVISPTASAFRTMLDPMTRVMMGDSQVRGMLIPSK